MSSSDPTVVVLAAGRSSRMGRAKALVAIDGEAAIDRVLRIARGHELDAIVVLGFQADEIRAAVEPGAARIVVNPDPARGQSSSVREGARALGPGLGIALWPVDHARVSEGTFGRLLAEYRARRAGIEIVVPSWSGRRGHPVLASAAVARELAALRDDEPAHAVIRREPARLLHLPVDDPMVVADFDRPQDLAPGPGSGGGGS